MSENQSLRQAALFYHEHPKPGKLEIRATKPMANGRDLARAYSPGVAEACVEIKNQPTDAARYTARGNLVAVVSNGSAVLGLGNIGALASKPVMEGKAVLFKKFANIDVFDIEIDERDPDMFVETVARLEPTFGGINLEDIKAPECFLIERKLRERMNIPVFHDDQHGTAIVVGAAIRNGLRVVGKDIAEVKLVASGAGAAALACLDLLVSMGLKREQVFVCDRVGVVYQGRTEEMDEFKASYAQDTDARALADIIDDADIFLGLSAPNVLKPELLARMADRPLIMALANPVPEIMPDEAKAIRPDAIISTGRSDYPNQVNNVLCFPFIFRGALDCGATTINEEMKVACAKAIADLAMAAPSDVVEKAYAGEPLRFGADYLIPKPFDPRLITEIASAVARAAMDSGVASRPIADLREYRRRLSRFVFHSGQLMDPLLERARDNPQRVVFTEGEGRRVLQAVQQVIDEGIAEPVLIGRPSVVEKRLQGLGLRLRPGEDFELINPESDDRFREYWTSYHELLGRRGVSPATAQQAMRTQNTVIGAMMMHKGAADAMLCGTEGRFRVHLSHVSEIIGKREGIRDLSTMTCLSLPERTLFLCDAHITTNPGVEEIAEMTVLAAAEIKRFGIEPKVALLSHSNFGSHATAETRKMAQARTLLEELAPELEVDGEMHADTALSEELRRRVLPKSRLKGAANLLVMPNLDAAHIAYGLLKMLGGGVSIGPILIGAALPAHVLANSITVRGILNMTAVSVVQAQIRSEVKEAAG